MAKGHRIPDELREQAVAMYRNGATYKEIAVVVGCRPQSLTSLFRMHVEANHASRLAIKREKLLAGGVQVCTRCKRELPFEEFYGRKDSKRSGRVSHCKTCCTETAKVPFDPDKVRFDIKLVEMPEVQKAYLAGLIDGEGHVGMTRRQRAGETYHTAVVQVGMTDTILCDLQDEVGVGTLHWNDRKNPNHKPCLMWRWGVNGIRALLPVLAPYLRVKAKQTVLVLEYLDLANHRLRRNPGDLAAYNRRVNEIYESLKVLNRRGR